MRTPILIITLLTISTSFLRATPAVEWPQLPTKNGRVRIPAQEWPQKPGPRSVRVLIHFPGGQLQQVSEQTGLMLTLHNWGGTDCVGTANPQVLADRLNVVAICVNYLQSGRKASVEDPQPYDFGYLQALDALRALWFVSSTLTQQSIPWADDRIFATGGSGGGNVTMMANKLAPRTFTAIVPMCGMARLNDDIAFNLPGGSRLNARWSRDSASPNFLSAAEQQIRDIGHPAHLDVMKTLGNTTHMNIVHGRDDNVCPFTDAERLVENLRAAELNVTPHFVGRQDLDGEVFRSTGHSLGNRTEIPFTVAEEALTSLRRPHPTDFERRDERVRYPVKGGTFIISYRDGYPVGRFEAANGRPAGRN